MLLGADAEAFCLRNTERFAGTDSSLDAAATMPHSAKLSRHKETRPGALLLEAWRVLLVVHATAVAACQLMSSARRRGLMDSSAS